MNIFFMHQWQTFLINVIKRLFSKKTLEYGFIKYEFEGGIGRGLFVSTLETMISIINQNNT